MNFLEQLVTEWYAYQGYYVRPNVKFGKRLRGGYEGEMDVVAFNPEDRTLVHVETSSDSDSWEERRRRFRKKFETGAQYYNTLFRFEFRTVKKIAVVGFSKQKSRVDFGSGVELVTIPEMIMRITEKIRRLRPAEAAIPEGYPLLRAIQFAVWYGGTS